MSCRATITSMPRLYQNAGLWIELHLSQVELLNAVLASPKGNGILTGLATGRYADWSCRVLVVHWKWNLLCNWKSLFPTLLQEPASITLHANSAPLTHVIHASQNQILTMHGTETLAWFSRLWSEATCNYNMLWAPYQHTGTSAYWPKIARQFSNIQHWNSCSESSSAASLSE